MSYTTLKIMFTRGDHCIQPGGLILRRCDDTGKLVTHRFNRLAHTREPTEFFWGHYFSPNNPGYEQRAEADYNERYTSCKPYEITEAELIANGDPGFSPSGIWEGNDHD